MRQKRLLHMTHTREKQRLLKIHRLPPCTSRRHVSTNCLRPVAVRLYGTKQRRCLPVTTQAMATHGSRSAKPPRSGGGGNLPGPWGILDASRNMLLATLQTRLQTRPIPVALKVRYHTYKHTSAAVPQKSPCCF